MWCSVAKPLYTVNKSPYSARSLRSCLDHLGDEGSLLLMEDGVYGALTKSEFADELTKLAQAKRLHVLGSDLDARGLKNERLISGIAVVDYEGFVDLAATHSTVIAWL